MHLDTPILSMYTAGDAKNEVPVTNLAKIKFPGEKEKARRECMPNSYCCAVYSITVIYLLISEINGISGKKAQLNSRQGGNSNEGREPLRPPSPQVGREF